MNQSNAQGKNAWFETCERIGQPSIFVADIARAWHLAKGLYPKDKESAILLQWQYGLISTTLNTMLNNLPVDVVRRQYIVSGHANHVGIIG